MHSYESFPFQFKLLDRRNTLRVCRTDPCRTEKMGSARVGSAHLEGNNAHYLWYKCCHTIKINSLYLVPLKDDFVVLACFAEKSKILNVSKLLLDSN